MSPPALLPNFGLQQTQPRYRSDGAAETWYVRRRVHIVTHSGGCHCGRVRFEVEAPAHLQLDVCNCSMCQRSGYKHLIVPAERFKLLSGQDSLTTYTFNTGTARHLFCSFCGIKSFYVPRSHPDGFSVNANCLDEGTVTGVTVRQVDGRHWETHYPDGKGAYDV